MYSVYKCRSLVVSETVFSLLPNYLAESKIKIDGWLDTFYNCRETGYVLHAYVSNEGLKRSTPVYVWVYEHRNSDCVMVIVSKDMATDNMFTEAGWKSAKGFSFGEYESAARYIADKLEEVANETI